jgi:hypothetical protein
MGKFTPNLDVNLHLSTLLKLERANLNQSCGCASPRGREPTRYLLSSSMAPVWSKHLRVTKDDKGNEILTAEPVSDWEQAAATDCIRACTQALLTEITVGDYSHNEQPPTVRAAAASGCCSASSPPGLGSQATLLSGSRRTRMRQRMLALGPPQLLPSSSGRLRPRARRPGHARQCVMTAAVVINDA